MKHQFLNNDVHKKLAKQLTVKISSHNLQLGFALFLCRGHEKVNPSVPIKAILKPIGFLFFTALDVISPN